MSSDFTTQANLDWIQSAVDSSGDATIANAWAELKADARSVMAQRDWAKGEMDRLEYADSQGRIERLVLDVSKRDEQLAAQAVEIQRLEIQVLRSNIDTLANDVHLFIPGCWRCTKCHFVLTRTSINAHTGDFGTTAADREDSEPCPNDGTEMVRVSWKERCKELGATAEQYCLETRTLQEVLAELRKYSHNSQCRYILTRAVKTCDCPKGIVDDYFKTEAWRVFLKAHGIELNSEGHSI